MGLLKDIYCAHCGTKTKLLFRTKLTDGSYLCSKCMSVVPWYMTNSFCLTYGAEDYNALLGYIEYSNENLRPVFTETHQYQLIHLDTVHNLFYIGNKINEKTVFLHLKYISEYQLVFHAESFKEGVFGDKVTGKVLFKIQMNVPYFHFEEILDRDVKSKAKTGFFGTEVQYENPKDMDEFKMFLDLALDADREPFRAQYADYEDGNLQQAMALFMIDDLDGVTPDFLREQRNRLIAIFHPDKSPDNDVKYAQKINSAYETLKKHL